MLLFFGLFANTAMAQKVQTWTAAVDTDWANAANWSETGLQFRTTGTTNLAVTTVNVVSTTGLVVGQAITGIGFAAGTTVATIPNATSFTISVATTAQTLIGNSILSSYAAPVAGAVPTATDVAVLNDNTISPPVITGAVTVNGFYISNTVGTVAGPTFTIPLGTTFNCNSSTAQFITVAGGNIVNNGTLSMVNLAMTFAAVGINFTTPIKLPGIATTYRYSGTGHLVMNTPAVTVANGCVIQSSAADTNSTIELLFNGTNDFTLSATIAASVIRTIATAAPSPVIIGGAGFTHGTIGSPKNGGIISMGNFTNLTINPETTINLYSAATNVTPGIVYYAFNNAAINTFLNRGTINILGTMGNASGMRLVIDATDATAAASIFNFENQNVLNVDVACLTGNQAALLTSTFVTAATSDPGTINITNTATGVMTLRNSQPFGNNLGSAIRLNSNTNHPIVTITSYGVLNLSGGNVNTGSSAARSIITNYGSINSNFEFQAFAITNSASGSITFVNPTPVATKGLSLTVLAAVTATVGATYTDGNGNTHTIGATKGNTGTALNTYTALGAIVPASGTLTGTVNIAYTAIGSTTLVSSQSNALVLAVTNNGVVNTGTGSTFLNVISGVTDASTGTIAPGGTGYGIAELNKASSTPDGTLKIQVAGNTAAGVDYDQLRNSFAASTLSLSSLDLNVSFLYTPTVNVSIPIVTGITITDSFATNTGLTPGWTLEYTGTAVNLVYTTANTWTGAASIDWTDATNWSAGVPNQNSDVTIVTTANQPVIASNVNINSLTITSGVLTVNPGFNLTVTGAVANNGGTMTLANNANLIQGGTSNSNTGNITVNRNSNALSRLDYTLWSSPVTGSQTLLGFSPLTSITPDIRFYIYSETSNLYSDAVPGNPFATATGYLIRMPNDAATAPATQTFAGIFTGVPNNGNISKAVTYNGTAPFGYNAIGNPYPSTIDAQAFITANTANIESSLYFWRKINAAAGSAYAVYNPMGSTNATPSSAVPNGTIQVGQGFFVKAKSATNVNFTNAMRVANIANQFFKTKAAQKDRLWVNLTNVSGVYSQALVGYTADAITGVDMYDAKFINDSKVALTSNINGEEFTIQGRPAFDATDVVGLNFKNDTAGDYTIALDQFDGVFATGQDIYLLDSKTGIETDLKVSSYTFAAVAGTDNARFSLKYQKTLKVNAPAFNENSVSVYKNNGTLYVNAGSVIINSIEVYDVQGRLLASQRNVKATTASINNLRASNQVLIVKIAGEDNGVVTKKVVN